MKVRPIKSIRQMLGVTQEELAQALGCTQVNISLYERGQALKPSTAALLIAFAQGKGFTLTYGMVYGAEPLPAKERVMVMGVST